jgi:methionyl-tRNA formyltransferase
MKIGLLCSGELGFKVLNFLYQNYNLTFVATDSKSDKIISYCQENNMSCFKGNPRQGKLAAFLNSISYDILISANYLFLIEKDVIQTAKQLAFNIHGSLLPKYRGRAPHVWAIINGEVKCGITAHKIDENCDTGDILQQTEIPITKYDTGASLLEKYKKEYNPIITSILEKWKKCKLRIKSQDETKATYFGKRTPESGQINWDWQSQRIYNWVRAQSYPYPGAFNFIENKKIIIDWIEPTDMGFKYTDDNGKILKIEDGIPFIKCPNRVMKATKIRNPNQVILKNNMILL